jgi:hypothetical protein
MPAAIAVDEDAWFSADPLTRQLERRTYDDVIVLRDRRTRGGRTRFDHIAVARSGVWVVASAEDAGRVDVTRGLLGRRRLLIRGEDRTSLVEDLEKQVEMVAGLAGGAYVTGALCLPNADLPLLRRLWLRDVLLCWPRGLRKLVNAPGELGEAEIASIADDLGERFPPA